MSETLIEGGADRILSQAVECRRKSGFEADTVADVRRIYQMALIVSEHLPKAMKRFGWNAWT